MFCQNFSETELFSRNFWILYNFIFQQRRWSIENFLVNCKMPCGMQNAAFVEVQHQGYYCTKIKKLCFCRPDPPLPQASLSTQKLCPPSTEISPHSVHRAENVLQQAVILWRFIYSFCLRFVITHYPENINNKKILIAAVCTDTGQLSKSIQQQEMHHSRYSDKSY